MMRGEELLWHEVRQVREQELKYLCDLGVYERVEERETTAQYQVTPVDLKWIDTNKASQRKPMQIRSRIVASEFKSEARPDLPLRDSSIGSVEGYNLECSTNTHSQSRTSTCHVHIFMHKL